MRQIAPLRFVNAGGTGSLELTATDPAVAEVAAGSGLFGPHLVRLPLIWSDQVS